MPVTVSNHNEGFESSSLTCSGLFLNRHNLHDLILQLISKEVVNYLIFLDGKRKQVNFFDGLNVAFLNKTSQFGNGNP